MTDPNTLVDADTKRSNDIAKYVIALVTCSVEALEHGRSLCPQSGPYLDALLALHSAQSKLENLIQPDDDPFHRSDGREVVTEIELSDGSLYEHIWGPDPETDTPCRRVIPRKDAPGWAFQIDTVPATQSIRVRQVPVQ